MTCLGSVQVGVGKIGKEELDRAVRGWVLTCSLLS